MAKQLTQYQVARLARKSSDITSLANQYKNSVNDLSNQYQSSFAEYQKKRDEIMAPYNAATDQYKADFTKYEGNLAGYKDRLSAYQKTLADYEANPYSPVNAKFYFYGKDGNRTYNSILVEGDSKMYSDNPQDVKSYIENFGYKINGRSVSKMRDAPEKFSEAAPTAPAAPEAPVIPEFDKAQFDTKRAELDTGYKRELGERKQARANAVSRKQARPLLQGA